MSDRLSGRPYNGNTQFVEMQQKEDSTFKVISTSFETPYDKVKKRQSQLSLGRRQLRSPNSQIDIINTSSTNYDVIDEVPRRKKAAHQVKLVVVGDGGCGKTCLLISYSRGEFPTAYVPTIFENYITNVESTQKKLIELQLWDTAGQEEYDRLRPLSYQNVNVILICYSVASTITLNNVKEKWSPEISHFCPEAPVILVGTKSDLLQDRDFLLNDTQSVSYESAEEVADLIGAKAHIRCSAKTMENVAQVFNIGVDIGLEISRANADGPKRSLRSKLFKGETAIDVIYATEYHQSGNERRRHRCNIL